MLLEGIFIPVTTPFYPDGHVYLRKLEHNLDRYSRTPAAGMLLLSETGEGPSLTDEESRQVLHTAIAATAPTKVMIASVGRPSVFATLDLANTAAMAGYDLLAIAPPAFAADESLRPELLNYFRAIADSAPLPLIVLAEHGQLSTDILSELATHPNILAAIDGAASPARMATLRERTADISHEVTVTPIFAAATGRMLKPTISPVTSGFVSAESLMHGTSTTATSIAEPAAHTTIKTRTKRVGFQVLAASAPRALEAWQAGATGALPRLSAAAPQACCEIWQAHKDGDPALAAEKQERIHPAAILIEGLHGIPAVKHACDLNGYFGGRPRLPLATPTTPQREAIEKSLAGMSN